MQLNNYNIIVINTSVSVVARIKSTFKCYFMGTNQNFDMSCSFSVGCGVLVFDHQNCILCAYITVSFEARKPPHHTHRFIEQSISFFYYVHICHVDYETKAHGRTFRRPLTSN